MFVSHLYVHLYVFFGEISVEFFGPLFDWVIHFSGIELQELLYIFEINSLSVASFAIIFSHCEGCLFTVLIVSFIVQKLLSLIGPICLFLFLFPIFWEVGHRRSCCDSCQSVLPMFSSRIFIVSDPTFRSLIYFEFIFAYGVRKCSSFIL